MHGLTGGSWKRSGHRATATGKNDLVGNHEATSGPETYRRPPPPRQLSTLLRNGNSARKFNAVDGYVHERLAILASRKHGLAGPGWGSWAAGRNRLWVRPAAQSNSAHALLLLVVMSPLTPWGKNPPELACWGVR